MLNEKKFWSLIEDAWRLHKEGNLLRLNIIKEGSEKKKLQVINEIMNETVMSSLSSILKNLSKSDLGNFDKILEERLFEIDREDVHNYVSGSNDSFLYKRGFLVGMGKDFYNKVASNPSEITRGNFDWHLAYLECQEMCFISRNIYRNIYDEEVPETNISRESFSNREGWPSGSFGNRE